MSLLVCLPFTLGAIVLPFSSTNSVTTSVGVVFGVNSHVPVNSTSLLSTVS